MLPLRLIIPIGTQVNLVMGVVMRIAFICGMPAVNGMTGPAHIKLLMSAKKQKVGFPRYPGFLLLLTNNRFDD